MSGLLGADGNEYGRAELARRGGPSGFASRSRPKTSMAVSSPMIALLLSGRAGSPDRSMPRCRRSRLERRSPSRWQVRRPSAPGSEPIALIHRGCCGPSPRSTTARALSGSSSLDKCFEGETRADASLRRGATRFLCAKIWAEGPRRGAVTCPALSSPRPEARSSRRHGHAGRASRSRRTWSRRRGHAGGPRRSANMDGFSARSVRVTRGRLAPGHPHAPPCRAGPTRLGPNTAPAEQSTTSGRARDRPTGLSWR